MNESSDSAAILQGPGTVWPNRSDAAPSASPRLVLTRRGRLAALIATSVVMLALALTLGASTLGASTPAGDSPVPGTETTTVTVAPDQTLWNIAAEANPHADIRRTVDEIMELNALPDARVDMGTKIKVPVYTSGS